MELWLAVIVLIIGMGILYLSSELAVDRLILLASKLGASLFTVGFVVSSIGSDLPEIVNSIISSYLGHGNISIGDSLGSVNTQITLVLGIIPFFCTFCRLIPREFAIVGISEVVIVAISVFLSIDGAVTRTDGLLLVTLWGLSLLIMRRFSSGQIAADDSEAIPTSDNEIIQLAGYILAGFIGIGIGSYMVIESAITISTALGVSEYYISFFVLSLGTSMPELLVAISAIRKRHFELAIGDIIGSCIVDATLAIGIGPIFFPITVDGASILYTGIYAILSSAIVVGVLTYRSFNDKKSGALFLLVYLASWLLPFLF